MPISAAGSLPKIGGMHVEPEPLMTSAEVSAWLNISPERLARLANLGEIDAIRVGHRGGRGDLRFEREAVEAYLESQRVPA